MVVLALMSEAVPLELLSAALVANAECRQPEPAGHSRPRQRKPPMRLSHPASRQEPGAFHERRAQLGHRSRPQGPAPNPELGTNLPARQESRKRSRLSHRVAEMMEGFEAAAVQPFHPGQPPQAARLRPASWRVCW
jgi:hypothetical protein